MTFLNDCFSYLGNAFGAISKFVKDASLSVYEFCRPTKHSSEYFTKAENGFENVQKHLEKFNDHSQKTGTHLGALAGDSAYVLTNSVGILKNTGEAVINSVSVAVNLVGCLDNTINGFVHGDDKYLKNAQDNLQSVGQNLQGLKDNIKNGASNIISITKNTGCAVYDSLKAAENTLYTSIDAAFIISDIASTSTNSLNGFVASTYEKNDYRYIKEEENVCVGQDNVIPDYLIVEVIGESAAPAA